MPASGSSVLSIASSWGLGASWGEQHASLVIGFAHLLDTVLRIENKAHLSCFAVGQTSHVRLHRLHAQTWQRAVRDRICLHSVDVNLCHEGKSARYLAAVRDLVDHRA